MRGCLATSAAIDANSAASAAGVATSSRGGAPTRAGVAAIPGESADASDDEDVRACAIIVPAQGRASGHALATSPSPRAVSLEVAKCVACSSLGAAGVRLEWSADERRISGQDRMYVSPGFHVDIPGVGTLPFKIVLHAAVERRQGQGAQGFKSADGWARLELKCFDKVPDDTEALISVMFGVGSGPLAQPMRGPVDVNFSHQGCCRLPVGRDRWHLPASVDRKARRVLVCIHIAAGRCASSLATWSA